MSVRIEGLDKVIANIKAIPKKESAKMDGKLQNAGDVAFTAIDEQAGVSDEHDQNWLNAHGNPYSTRYTKDSGPHLDAIVHKQSGLLNDSLQANEKFGAAKSSVEIGVSEADVPYIGDLIYGTSKMRPRDFITAGWEKSKDKVIAIMGERR